MSCRDILAYLTRLWSKRILVGFVVRIPEQGSSVYLLFSRLDSLHISKVIHIRLLSQILPGSFRNSFGLLHQFDWLCSVRFLDFGSSAIPDLTDRLILLSFKLYENLLLLWWRRVQIGKTGQTTKGDKSRIDDNGQDASTYLGVPDLLLSCSQIFPLL